MFVRKSSGPRTATLPDGSILTLADLPDGSERWVARRKIVVAQAIAHGLLSRDEALSRYGLTEEELLEWMKALSVEGAGGSGASLRLRRWNPHGRIRVDPLTGN